MLAGEVRRSKCQREGKDSSEGQQRRTAAKDNNISHCTIPIYLTSVCSSLRSSPPHTQTGLDFKGDVLRIRRANEKRGILSCFKKKTNIFMVILKADHLFVYDKNKVRLLERSDRSALHDFVAKTSYSSRVRSLAPFALLARPS